MEAARTPTQSRPPDLTGTTPAPTHAATDGDRDARVIGASAAWFAAHQRDLPWRDGATPWGVLVSEVMAQQTPVARVEPVWREWLARWPEPADLAAASQADAVRAWGRLGYPRRAQRLWECAGAIVARHGGQVPADLEDLRALPGVGEYTAAAVVAFAFGGRVAVLDTNVRRVIGRVWRGEALPRPHVTSAERAHAQAILPPQAADAARWAVAAMELGALVCTARAARCEECPLTRDCAWYIAGKPGLETAQRRGQAWHGTDRQVRGRILALLREATGAVDIEAAGAGEAGGSNSGAGALADVPTAQLERCLASLAADGLVTADPAGGYRL